MGLRADFQSNFWRGMRNLSVHAILMKQVLVVGSLTALRGFVI
ncbi:Hypothetical protein Bdt_1206 [Bdellovibrio bacteriovorus str. Tiberius]|uniref:Uncharacterized protein n=1 Tax=Bdellovibrio bacteriovorus str. Tiberius TaxID=1069642 RepID=K7YW41_BDEBC|nr:Hypothetical protein Bdt_1206 [Bdellovibrio bacteriovorus str. Tiberius]